MNYLYLTCLLFKKNNWLLKQFFAIKEKLIEDEFNFSQAQKAQKKWIQFFLQGHNAHNTRIPLFFACLNKLHNIQSSFFQIEKDAKIVFVFMKNEFIIWGASALRLSGPFYFFAEERTSKKSTDSLFRIYESPKDTNSILLQAKNTQTKC